MVKQGLSCDGWSWGIERYCRDDANWDARKPCQQECTRKADRDSKNILRAFQNIP